MKFTFFPLSMIPIISLLSLLPGTMVFGQTSPWSLFQQLCPTGRLATGPQCHNLQIQQQQQQSSASSSASSQACPPAFTPLCAQGTTGSVNTTSQAGSGTCPSGFTLQGNFCIPLTSTTIPQTTTGACPANTILQNGVCVP